MRWETMEDFVADLEAAGVPDATVKAATLWASPGAMYDAAPILEVLLPERFE